MGCPIPATADFFFLIFYLAYYIKPTTFRINLTVSLQTTYLWVYSICITFLFYK